MLSSHLYWLRQSAINAACRHLRTRIAAAEGVGRYIPKFWGARQSRRRMLFVCNAESLHRRTAGVAA